MQVILTEKEFEELKAKAQTKAPYGVAESVLAQFRKHLSERVGVIARRSDVFEHDNRAYVYITALASAVNESADAVLKEYEPHKSVAGS